MARPKILIDARMVFSNNHGIGAYVLHLAQSLATHQDTLAYDVELLVCSETSTKDLPKSFKQIKSKRCFLNPLEQFEIPKILKLSNPDLFHSPSFSSPIRARTPHISTIHDLNHLHFGSVFQKLYYRFILKPYARAAKKIVTVSEFSRFEITRWIKEDEANISIAYNPIVKPQINRNFFARTLLLKKGFFLVVGNEKTHKNMNCVIEAHNQYAEISKIKKPLVIVGLKSPIQLNRTQIYFEKISTPELWSLYENAALTLAPATYEGFGRIPVEAIVAGSPVAVSDIPPHHEGLRYTSNQSKLFLDPKTPDAWLDALQKSDSAPFQEPTEDEISKTLEIFSEESLFKTMDQIYRSVLGISS